MQRKKILLVDDEEDILEFLSYYLTKEGYKVKTCCNGFDAIVLAEEFLPDLIILDVMMPEMNGIKVCAEMKKRPNLKNSLITFLTARNDDLTEISALDEGGDDFIHKPIKPKVLNSRIKALLRRQIINQEEPLENKMVFEDITIDLENMKVSKDRKNIKLAKKEFELLALLASKPDKVFKRKNIMKKVWGAGVIVGDRTIDVHIRKLRKKIGKHYIDTYKGVGYKFIG
ncbi:MAG: response regulator transcription factor [Saprospiraceae bacterium]